MTGVNLGNNAANVARIGVSGSPKLPPRARRLLEKVRTLCEAQLEPLLRNLLDDLDEQLFRLADQARNNAEQEACLMSQREIRRGRADVVPRFLSHLGDRFARFGEPREAAGGEAGALPETLSLVDMREQEESMALDGFAARAEVRAGMSLFELGHRFAVLVGTPVVEADALPAGPRAMCEAWREASTALDLPPQHRQLLHRLFEQHLLHPAASMFEAANALLREQGILPNLRASLSRRMIGPSARVARGDDASDAADPPAHADPAHSAQATAPEAPREGAQTEAAFNVLRGLLARRRNALGLDSIPQDGAAASDVQLQDVLARLQHTPPAPMMVDGKPQPRTMQHVRQDALAQLRGYGEDGRPLHFSAEQADTIDLVSMLFDHLERELPGGGHASTLMSRLQVPMLRVALADTGFFAQHEHPARRLMDTVAETATQWLDGAGEAADPALAAKLRLLVDRALNEFDGDLGLLEDLRNDLDDHMTLLKRRAEMAERRHVEAAQGRERLELARRRANELVSERLQGGEATGLLRTMLEQAWTDVLALTILRWGERSEAFRKRLAVTDRLLRREQQGDDPQLREEIAEGLGQVGIHGNEAEQIAERVVAPQATSEEAPLTRTELAMRLKQRQRLGHGQEEPKPAEAAAEAVDPARQEAMERLRQLPFGAWLEFVQPDGKALRRKLAWFSPVTGHCLVVNQRGMREDIGSLEGLAAAMAAGRVRLPSERRESLLDRAWSAIVGTLRQFAPATEQPA